jgi:protein ImuB
MLHKHLENFTSKSPIVAVALEAEPTKPGRQQFSLFETALRNPMQLSETLAQLTGLLGADRVGTPVLEETHRPDAFRIEPFSWELPPTDSAAEQPMPSSALRRLRPAPVAAVLREHDTPAHLRSAQIEGAVVQSDGPFFASGNWWDANGWSRAEWDLQLANAVCRCHSDGETWRLDGVYD